MVPRHGAQRHHHPLDRSLNLANNPLIISSLQKPRAAKREHEVFVKHWVSSDCMPEKNTTRCRGLLAAKVHRTFVLLLERIELRRYRETGRDHEMVTFVFPCILIPFRRDVVALMISKECQICDRETLGKIL